MGTQVSYTKKRTIIKADQAESKITMIYQMLCVSTIFKSQLPELHLAHAFKQK